MAVCLNHYSVIWVNLLEKGIGKCWSQKQSFLKLFPFSDIKVSRKGNRLVDSAIKLRQNDLLINSHYNANLIEGYCSSWSCRYQEMYTVHSESAIFFSGMIWEHHLGNSSRQSGVASVWSAIDCVLWKTPFAKVLAISLYLQKLLSNLYLVI